MQLSFPLVRGQWGRGGSTALEQQLSLQESQLCARQGACATGTAPAAGAVNILILQTDNKVSYPLAQGHANLFMPGSREHKYYTETGFA